MLENIIERIHLLSDELRWIDSEISKIMRDRNAKYPEMEYLPEGRVDMFSSVEENDVIRLEFLLLRNREIRYRIEDIYSSIRRLGDEKDNTFLCER